MRVQLVAAILLLSIRLNAAEGPKVFIESISQPVQKDSILFRGRTTTQGAMPPASEIERVLVRQCAECVFVAKQDKADYVLTFSAVGANYEWSVIDNAGDGKRIASKQVVLEGNAYKDAINVVKAHWAQRPATSAKPYLGDPDLQIPELIKKIPETKVIKWELPENAEGIYEVKVSSSEVGPNGAMVRIKVVKP